MSRRVQKRHSGIRKLKHRLFGEYGDPTGCLLYTSLGSLFVAVTSSRSAKKVKGQIADEEQTTRQLIDWFTANHNGEQLDRQILGESGDLSPEELSLKRFELIQDLIITNHDITDQAYVDALAEEIYGKVYEE